MYDQDQYDIYANLPSYNPHYIPTANPPKYEAPNGGPYDPYPGLAHYEHLYVTKWQPRVVRVVPKVDYIVKPKPAPVASAPAPATFKAVNDTPNATPAAPAAAASTTPGVTLGTPPNPSRVGPPTFCSCRPVNGVHPCATTGR